jgi:hypothetical protein
MHWIIAYELCNLKSVNTNKYSNLLNKFLVMFQLHDLKETFWIFFKILRNPELKSESLGVWDLIIARDSKQLVYTTFRKCICFRVQVRRRDTSLLGSLALVQWLTLALFKRSNRFGVALLSPEDGNESTFQNVVFFSYLEFWTMDKVHKSSDSECYVPSSEPFIFYLNCLLRLQYVWGFCVAFIQCLVFLEFLNKDTE